ncbi:MAG: hypothetical protein KC910_23655 [Candidatus Eremiobacteraeota bacterium]|nr:hypothetical protein [Candidatus Eremiobacteraeota bacterium]
MSFDLAGLTIGKESDELLVECVSDEARKLDYIPLLILMVAVGFLFNAVAHQLEPLRVAAGVFVLLLAPLAMLLRKQVVERYIFDRGNKEVLYCRSILGKPKYERRGNFADFAALVVEPKRISRQGSTGVNWHYGLTLFFKNSSKLQLTPQAFGLELLNRQGPAIGQWLGVAFHPGEAGMLLHVIPTRKGPDFRYDKP